ncbi:MAG: hypothetical protein KatS3mg061_1913 [Dehalococcoidia bacterium]|nr:MAG: hypothetical protein KatS3mg061_1913 [Dehalococcoidia bacterium]
MLLRALRAELTLSPLTQDGFASAEQVDETSGHSRGLRLGQAAAVAESGPAGLLVKSEVARRHPATPATPAEALPCIGPAGPTPSPQPATARVRSHAPDPTRRERGT